MRKDTLWNLRNGTYMETVKPTGYDILINGTDKYLNWGSTSGSSGYGIRDNGGTMEFKNSGGAWTGFGAGGGGVGPGTINEIAYFDTTTTVNSLPVATYPSLTELSYVKGVTSAIQTQINAKQATLSLTTTGSSGASTFDGSTLNVPNYTLAGLGMTFGTDNQVPFTNATGTGFDYNSDLVYDGHTMMLGNGTLSSTYRLQLEESANVAVYMLVRHNTSGTNSTAQLAVVTPTAGGFFGAFDNSHNQAAWRDKAMFGAYSTASGIQIAAYNSGQKIWFQVGGLAASNIWATMLGTGHLSLASNLDPLTNLHIQEATTETLPAVYINQTSTGDSALQFSIVGDAYAMGIDNSDNDSFKISYSATAGAAVLGTNDRFVILATGEVGIGTTNIGAKLHVLNTTQQLRLGYDASNYFATTVDSNGLTTFDATGAGAGFVFDDTVTVQVLLTNTGITPDADDGAFLGQAGLAWSDLFLAEGAVINWDSGDITITQTGDTLAFAGGTNYTFNDRITASGEIVFDGTTTSSGAGAIGVTGSIHEITTTGIGDALTLADGVEGQRLTIVYVAEGAGTDTAVLTPTNFGSGTTITFATIGQSARLLFTNAKWYADGSPFGAVIA